MSKKLTNKKSANKAAKAARKSASSSKLNALPFSPESLGELFDFLKEKGITEFEWSKENHKISVKTTYGTQGIYTHAASQSHAHYF